MPRKIPALVLLAGLALAGEEAAPDADAEALRALRVAMEAKLKIGDAKLAAGDREGALQAYADAVAMFEKASPTPARARAAAPQPLPVRPVAAGDAVDRALQWLTRCQSLDDGRWDCDEFARQAGGDGPGRAEHDAGVTGLALLAFLGAGHTDRGEDAPYAKTVRSGLRWLISVQEPDGRIGHRRSTHFIYDQAIATAALCDAFALTRNPRYRAPAQSAVDFILAARNPYLGWRYGSRTGENDTSVTGWCVVALASAEKAGLAVDRTAFQGALAWVDKMTDPDTGAVGYVMRGGMSARMEGQQEQFPPDRTEAMTASGVLTRVLCGEDPGATPAIARGIRRLAAKPPRWDVEDGSIDLYYWLLGTMALARANAPELEEWRRSLQEALRPNQRADGSFDPVDAWGPAGGRVYATAVGALCLEAASAKPAN